jgi:hypothetical protein
MRGLRQEQIDELSRDAEKNGEEAITVSSPHEPRDLQVGHNISNNANL